MTHENPLWHRLHFDPCYTEVARMVGYAGIPLPEARQKADALAERFGQPRVQAGAIALSCTDTTREPHVVHLTEEARRVCFQLLGPPPEAEWVDGPACRPSRDRKEQPKEKVRNPRKVKAKS